MDNYFKAIWFLDHTEGSQEEKIDQFPGIKEEIVFLSTASLWLPNEKAVSKALKNIEEKYDTLRKLAIINAATVDDYREACKQISDALHEARAWDTIAQVLIKFGL